MLKLFFFSYFIQIYLLSPIVLASYFVYIPIFSYKILKNLELWNLCLPFPTALSMGPSIEDGLWNVMHSCMANTALCVSPNILEKEEMP